MRNDECTARRRTASSCTVRRVLWPQMYPGRDDWLRAAFEEAAASMGPDQQNDAVLLKAMAPHARHGPPLQRRLGPANPGGAGQQHSMPSGLWPRARRVSAQTMDGVTGSLVELQQPTATPFAGDVVPCL